MMKTIILCGGKGTRLNEETEFRPKPLVEIGGKPILWHIMKIYAQYGYRDFILALGYKGDLIKEFFLNQKAFTCDFTLNTKTYRSKFYFENKKETEDFNITFVDTGVETLIGGRILQCQSYVHNNDDGFMVTYGDGVSNLNISDLVSFHKKKNLIGTITGVHPRSRFGLIKISKDNIVKSFIEKPLLDDWISGGFMVFKKSFFKFLRHNEMDDVALTRLVAKGELAMYTHNGFWYCLDTYKDYLELNKMWSGNPEWKVWP